MTTKGQSRSCGFTKPHASALYSPKLRELQLFVLRATRKEVQVAAQERIYTMISSIEAAAATGASTPVTKTFPTLISFNQAIVHDLDAAVPSEERRKVPSRKKKRRTTRTFGRSCTW